MKYLLFLFIIGIIICVPSVSAMEINLLGDSYFSGETFQANITGEFIGSLTVNNIFFVKDGKEVGLAFYLLKISDREYWVYVDLPQQIGNYTFAVKNALYREDGVLKGNEKEKTFEIKQSITSFYKDIAEKTAGKFSSLGTESNSLALIALAYDNSLFLQAKNALLAKKDSAGCWPSASCNTKDTSLALFSLKKSSVDSDSSWLVDAQNNLDVGLWNLVITSAGDSQCEINVNSEKTLKNVTSGDNTIALDLKGESDEVSVIANCSVLNTKILHTYMGKIHEFPMQKQGDIFSATLNNKKCFGSSYRSECNSEATAYSILALDALGLDKSKALDWLAENAQTTKEKSIALYFGKSELKEFLLNNQHNDGYWTRKSLIEETSQDIESTVFAVWALSKAKENDAAEKGKEWLKKNIYGNLTNELLSSAFVFSNSEIESISSINPAVIKAKVNSNISVLVKNKGIVDLTASANFLPFKARKDFAVKTNGEEKIEFAIPSKLGNKEITDNITGNIDIILSKFLSEQYSIPVMIIADKSAITNFTPEVPKEHFQFIQQEINATMLVKENNLIPVAIKNLAPRVIKGISISYSRDLDYILNLTSLHISEIDAGSEVVINLLFKSQKTGNYGGFIEASSGGISAVLPVNITFTKNESQVKITNITAVINKTCRDYNGSVCKKEEICSNSIPLPEGRCCIGKCEGKKDLRMLGVIMITLAVLVIAITLYAKMRKPKREMKDVMSEIENKYDKFKNRKQYYP